MNCNIKETVLSLKYFTCLIVYLDTIPRLIENSVATDKKWCNLKCRFLL